MSSWKNGNAVKTFRDRRARDQTLRDLYAATVLRRYEVDGEIEVCYDKSELLFSYISNNIIKCSYLKRAFKNCLTIIICVINLFIKKKIQNELTLSNISRLE